MKPLAVWYHAKIEGEGIPSPEFAFDVMAGQLAALQASGLAEHAQEIHFGVNGTEAQALAIVALAPPQTVLHVHGPEARTEIPTLELLRRWLPDKDGWYILYHHTKGVTHPTESLYTRWRDRMEMACVWDWPQCVADLDRGYDAVGCHWLTPEKFRSLVTSPFFGGTFWWSKTEYLKQLPALPAPTWENRFEAESWIGRRRPYPRVRDYYPGWP